MNDNVRKIFDLLGVEPNEEFKINGYDRVFYFDKELNIHFHFNQDLNLYSENDEWMDISLQSFINGTNKIIKLSKESKQPKKKKLRDWNMEEYKKWLEKTCKNNICDKCIFNNVVCSNADCSWIYHKDLYSDKFLDQEIEVE